MTDMVYADKVVLYLTSKRDIKKEGVISGPIGLLQVTLLELKPVQRTGCENHLVRKDEEESHPTEGKSRGNSGSLTEKAPPPPTLLPYIPTT